MFENDGNRMARAFTWLLVLGVLAITLLLLIVPAVLAQALAPPAHRHLVPITVLRVYDGDTITAAVATVWPGQNVSTAIRLNGIDTPEIRGDCDRERELAVKARDLLRERLARAALIQIADPFHGRWAGRVVAAVLVDGVDVGGMLVSAGFARVYDGGTRLSWCTEGDDADE